MQGWLFGLLSWKSVSLSRTNLRECPQRMQLSAQQGQNTKRLSIKYVRKISRKTNISNPLIRTRKSAYQGVRNVSFSENFAYVLHGWPLTAEVSNIFSQK